MASLCGLLNPCAQRSGIEVDLLATPIFFYFPFSLFLFILLPDTPSKETVDFLVPVIVPNISYNVLDQLCFPKINLVVRCYADAASEDSVYRRWWENRVPEISLMMFFFFGCEGAGDCMLPKDEVLALT